MKKALVLMAFLASAACFAAANCKKHPKEEWMQPEVLQARLKEQGYKIKKFKVDGNCYEIYGWDKDGKKVEIYFDAKDGSVVKSRVKE